MTTRPGLRWTTVTAVLLAGLTSVVGVGGSRASTSPLLAWGSNGDRQLGPATAAPSSAIPVEVAGLGEVASVAAGVGHSLALKTDGTVWSWGRNGENELGDGVSMYMPRPGPSPRPDPAPVSGLSGVTAIAAGWYHSLAIKDGAVWAWGENNCGQLGSGKLNFGTPQNALSPPTPGRVVGLPAEVVAVAAGRGHSMALDVHGVLWAWGENRWGQLGIGHGGTRSTSADCPMPSQPDGRDGQIVPVKVALGSRVLAFAAGSDHSLALTEDGTVWSWGNNCAGQLGPVAGAAPRSSQNTPLPVTGFGISKVVALAAGGSAGGGHSLALDRSGQVWAWGLADVLGRNELAGAGDPSPCSQDPLFPTEVVKSPAGTEDFPNQKVRIAPQPVKDTPTSYLSGVVSLTAGMFHSMALQADGTVLAWGKNAAGELGPLPSPGATAATAVKSLERSVEGPMAMVAARSHTLAVRGTPPPRPAFVFPADEVPADPGEVVPGDPGELVPDDPSGLLPVDPDDVVPVDPEDPPGDPPVGPGDVPDDPADLTGNREGPIGGSGGGVIVSGFAHDRMAAGDVLHNEAGAQQVVRRAIAYATPGDTAPRLLFVPRDIDSIRGLEASGFRRCSEPAGTTDRGCFDVAYNTSVFHPSSDDGPGVPHPGPHDHEPDRYRGPADRDLNSVALGEYDALVAGTALYFADHDVLVQRRSELYDYVAAGGGVVAFMQIGRVGANDGADPPYQGNSFEPREIKMDFLPFLDQRRMGDPEPVAGYTVTAEGRGLGLTEGDLNGNPAVAYFAAPCGFDVFSRFSDGRIVLMGTHKPIPTPCVGARVPDVRVKEGDAGVTPATFTVSLGQARDTPVRVDYTTVDAGATAGDVCPDPRQGGADYLTTSGTLTFPAGDTGPLTVSVPVCGDQLSEAVESFLLKVTSPDDVGMEMTATGTIENDDGDPPGEDLDTGTTPGGGDRGENASQAPVQPAQPVQVPAPAPVVAPAPAAAAAPAVALAPALAPAPAPAQATSQAQAQQGSQAQAQQGSQAQAQAGSPAQAQAGSPAQATAASPQVGMATDEQRQTQVEKASIDGAGDPDTLLASARQPSPVAPVALFGAAVAVALGLGGIRRRPVTQRSTEPVPHHPDGPDPGDRRLWLRRARHQR